MLDNLRSIMIIMTSYLQRCCFSRRRASHFPGTEKRRFPGCDRPVEAAAETVGRPPRYCDLSEHTAQTAFRERRRRAAAGEFEGEQDQGGGERPVSLAIAPFAARRVRDRRGPPPGVEEHKRRR
jgi:hypothetical protein